MRFSIRSFGWTKSDERYRLACDAACAIAIYIVSFAFSFPPLMGLLAFGFALERLVRCVSSPASALAGDWLLGLSWLANPAAWTGMVCLLAGRAKRAALSGVVALLLAACVFRLSPFFLFQYIWLGSMAYIVYAALRVPNESVAANNQDLARPRLPKLRPIFYPAIAIPIVFGLLVLLLTHWGLIRSAPLFDESDLNDCVHTGEDAKRRILATAERDARPGADKPGMPESASNFWLYEDGWLSKRSTFWMFDCGSREDCLKAVEILGGLGPKELSPWQPSRYAVIMEGPAFYSRNVEPSLKLRTNPWDVRGIRNGLVHELVTDRDLYYYAIDFDRCRVFYLCEFRCFHRDEYEPTRK
jgi:hypothetical protein